MAFNRLVGRFLFYGGVLIPLFLFPIFVFAEDLSTTTQKSGGEPSLLSGSSCSDDLYASFLESSDGDNAVYSVPPAAGGYMEWSQGFSTTTSFTITCVRMKVYRTESIPAHVNLYIKETYAGKATGTALAAATDIDVSAWTTSEAGDWEAINLDTTAYLTANQVYAVDLTCDDCVVDDLVRFHALTTGGYSEGQLYGTYTAHGWDDKGDMNFEIYGTAEEPPEEIASSTYLSFLNCVDTATGTECGINSRIFDYLNIWFGVLASFFVILIVLSFT